MSSENLTTFEEMLREDGELQAKLQEAVNAYDGDRSDERAFFDATIGKLATEANLPFSFEEATEFLASSRELSDEEMDAVAGGGGFCYVIGGSNDVEAECGMSEGHACAYVGVSIPDLTR